MWRIRSPPGRYHMVSVLTVFVEIWVSWLRVFQVYPVTTVVVPDVGTVVVVAGVVVVVAGAVVVVVPLPVQVSTVAVTEYADSESGAVVPL